MDKVKHGGLRRSLFIYLALFALAAFAASCLVSLLCNFAISKIKAGYPLEDAKRYYLTDENGQRLGEGAIIGRPVAQMDKKDAELVNLFGLVQLVSSPILAALCILLSAVTFWKKRLKGQLAQLKTASEKISQNDLDFSLKSLSDDELGQLCRSFENMRAALANNFYSLWRQVQQREQVNAAFAHQLRTPLTVLKGYCELLSGSEQPQTRETAQIMARNIARIEGCAAGMTSLHRLEDACPTPSPVNINELTRTLAESGRMLCASKGVEFCVNNTQNDTIMLDQEFVNQVYTALLSNAVRHAKGKVTLSAQWQNDIFTLTLEDDGDGFDAETLKRAAEPYFTRATGEGHFGLGLYICRLLCERHGGRLRISDENGVGRVSADFCTNL